MAKKRMISIDICGGDDYLDLPPLAQSLYIQCIITADDDGLLSGIRKLARSVGAKAEDISALADAGFIIQFDSGVVAISHWLIHNTVRKDRYTRSVHFNERNQICVQDDDKYSLEEGVPYSVYLKKVRKIDVDNQMATNGQPSDNQMATNGKPSDNQMATNGKPMVNPDKISIDKSRVDYSQSNNNIYSNDLGGGRYNSNTGIIQEGQPSPTAQAPPPPDTHHGRAEPKKAYGTYKHVLLSADDFKELREKYTDDEIQDGITYTDNYVQMKGNKQQDYKLSLMKWGIDGGRKERKKQEGKSPPTNSFIPQMKRDYDMDELEAAVLAN